MRKDLFDGLGLEAIDFQSGALFAELTQAFAKVRGKGKKPTEADIQKLDIPAIVFAHTGLRITFELRFSLFFNAHVLPGMVDRNHPLLKGRGKMPMDADGIQKIKSTNQGLMAGIDRKRGRVSGLYSELVSHVSITTAAFNSEKFTDAEIAALLLHELGHAFTYYEFLGNTFTTNYVLLCTVNAINKTDSIKERQVLLKAADTALGVNVSKGETLASKKLELLNETLPVVYISALGEKSRSELGMNLYDLRSWEQLSDQFATRHGAGKDLVTALDKIYRSVLHSSTYSQPVFLAMEAFKVVRLAIMGFVATANPVVAAILVLRLTLMLIVLNPQEKFYDDPEARAKLVKQQLTEALKDKELTSDERKKYLQDIELIDEVLQGLNDRKGYVKLLWSYVLPWGKKGYQDEVVMKQMEELANNELFISANRFLEESRRA